MRKITITLLTLLWVFTAYAGPVSRQQAMQTAAAYLNKHQVARGVTQQAKLTLAYECLPKVARGAGVTSPLYYVFNQDQQQGFVVVAGDDRVKPVLGYVDNGSFTVDDANSGVRWWLGALEQTMISVAKIADDGRTFEVATDNSDFAPSVEPLVKVTWGQSGPHNDLCPMDNAHGQEQHSLVGCTAVAMAQVLSKWKYPAGIKGYVNYTTPRHNIKVSEDLSNYPFEWENILPSYAGGKGTQVQKEAIAKLMYACGLSVKMDYCSIASGAKLTPNIFRDYFGMDEKCNLLVRHFYTKPEWDEIMKRELNEGRPVVYSGYSLEAGHAFVCDGYNTDGLFHINWGWDGSMNGYFALAELNSAVEYAGAPTDEAGSFNMDQDIVIGIQPDDNVTDDVEQVAYFHSLVNYPKVTNRTELTMDITYVTPTGNGFKGTMSLGVFDNADNLVCTFGTVHQLDVALYSFYKSLTIGGALPDDLENGLYTLRPVSSYGGKPYRVMKGRASSPYVSYLTMKVIGNNVILSEPSEVKAKFTILSAKPMNGKAFAGAKNPIEIRLRNDGALYNGPIVIQRPVDGGQKRVFANNYVVDKGEEVVIRTNVEAPAGVSSDELVLWMAGKDEDQFITNGFDYAKIGSVKFDLIVPTPGTPVLSVSNLSMKENMVHVGQPIEVDFTLKNTGGFYGNNISAYVFGSESIYSVTSVQTMAYIDKDETLDVHLDINIDNLKEGGYYYYIYYNDPKTGQLTVIGNKSYSFHVNNTGSIPIRNTEFYGAICADHAFVLPAKSQAGVVTHVDNNNVTVDYRYQEGDVVPANTPIIVKAGKRGTLSYTIVKSDKTAPADNLLSAKVDDRGFTYAGEGEYKYYKFYHDGSRKNYGFYMENPDGAPFELDYNAVYLAVPVAKAKADGYPLNGAATGIENLLEDNRVNAVDAIYTPAGVRVSGNLKSLPKGIYIVGGKKVYVK